MAKPYSLELRERVVAAVVVEELPQQEAARLFGVGLASLERWLARWRLGESLGAIEPVNSGRPPLLDQGAYVRLEAQLAAAPDARLSDQVRAWQEATGQHLSAPTLWRALRLLGQTRKKSTSSMPDAMKPSGPPGKKRTRG